jgi:hypothetical protein
MTAPVRRGVRRWTKTSLERFMEKIDFSGDCWTWTAAKTPAGYAIFYFNGHVAGHRWAYEQFAGPIPEGLVLDHLCRNRACVNPDHLEPVTNRENLLRGVGPSADCARRTHCPQNHPYDEANTARGSRGERKCRTCNRERNRTWRERNRATAEK